MGVCSKLLIVGVSVCKTATALPAVIQKQRQRDTKEWKSQS